MYVKTQQKGFPLLCSVLSIDFKFDAIIVLQTSIWIHLFLFCFTFCRCEVGTDNWTQCNDHPIKICKYPVPGLFEGHSYYFRVRAVNSHGISKPSRMSDAIAALDPTEFGKLHGGFDCTTYEEIAYKIVLQIHSLLITY